MYCTGRMYHFQQHTSSKSRPEGVRWTLRPTLFSSLHQSSDPKGQAAHFYLRICDGSVQNGLPRLV